MSKTVTHDASGFVIKDYIKSMLLRSVITGLPLVALPAIAAESSSATGVTSVGPAMFFFTVAAALILSLLFRHTATRLGNIAVQRLGNIRIRRALEKRTRDVLHDFILPGAYGGLAKIDHAILTSGGILCIKTVHCHGVVFGGEEEAQWTNVDGISRRRFLNPLIQNEGRRRALGDIVPDVPVANLVVFTGNVEFPNPLPSNVIRVSDLDSYIARYVFGPSKIEDWDAVWMSIKSAAMTDDATRADFKAQLGFS